MDVIKINGKDYELKYTFNSFKYMEELDLRVLGQLEFKPFKMISLLEILLMGALNHDPEQLVGPVLINQYMESTDDNLKVLMENLVEKLGDSNFFKQLQAE